MICPTDSTIEIQQYSKHLFWKPGQLLEGASKGVSDIKLGTGRVEALGLEVEISFF